MNISHLRIITYCILHYITYKHYENTVREIEIHNKTHIQSINVNVFTDSDSGVHKITV